MHVVEPLINFMSLPDIPDAIYRFYDMQRQEYKAARAQLRTSHEFLLTVEDLCQQTGVRASYDRKWCTRGL